MTTQEAKALIQQSGGKIVAVEFVKRSTGELRLMACRTGVYSHLRGGTKGYNDDDHGLLTVFDMNRNGYRSIPLDGIRRVKVNGEWVEVS